MNKKFDQNVSNANYKNEMGDSILSYPSVLGGPGDLDQSYLCVAGKAVVEAEVLIIKNPDLFNGKLPAGKILVAPYFRNDWILDLENLAGVVLEQGGVLSHSAIVAREKNIPYFIHVSDATEQFECGQKVRLHPTQSQIERV